MLFCGTVLCHSEDSALFRNVDNMHALQCATFIM